MSIIEENGKRYELDDDGRVVHASLIDPIKETKEEVEVVEDVSPLKIGERVEAEGKLGHLVLIAPTMYGDAYSVRFDDGTMESYLEDHVKRSNLAAVVAYEVPAEDIRAEWEKLISMPDHTYDQIEEKLAIARQLRLRAKALVTDSRLPLQTRTILDQVVTSATAEITDLEDSKNFVREGDQSYVDSLPRYEMPASLLPSGDGDWIIGETEVESFYDETATTQAISNAVNAAPRSYLENEAFLRQITEFAEQVTPKSEHDKIASIVRTAIEDRLAQPEQQKEASVESINLEDVDASDLYI